MMKRRFLLIASVLLLIGSGATVFATIQKQVETSSSPYILLQARESCSRCRGSGFVSGRGGSVRCPGPSGRPCPVLTRR